jgi:chromosome partitioning protein
MKTLALVSQKGGAGKTTLAIHLSVAGHMMGVPTVFLDLDPQKSAFKWGEDRESAPKPLHLEDPKKVEQSRHAAMSAGCQFMVIDSAPNAEVNSLHAMKAADFVLIPSRPTILDLNAIETTVELAKLINKPHAVVFNHCPPVGVEVEHATARLTQGGVPVCPIYMHARKAFSNGLIGGLTAQETEPNSKAADEIAALFEWVTQTLKMDLKVAA